MNNDVPHLILASESLRRQELLRDAGYLFDVQPPNVDESEYPEALGPVDLARHLSLLKAAAISPQFPDHIVLAADTVVAFGERALGKPADSIEARRMLSLLSGTTHVVITGVTVIRHATGFQQTRHAMSAVRMRKLTVQEIQDYVASRQWEGKAGGYGIQDKDPFVTNISGSHTNIVGLPMELAAEMLAAAGIPPSN